MSGLRNGRDGLFPKIKYQNYTLITLREINDSAGACGGQNAELPCELGESSQTQLRQQLWTFWRKNCLCSLGQTSFKSSWAASPTGWDPILVLAKRF